MVKKKVTEVEETKKSTKKATTKTTKTVKAEKPATKKTTTKKTTTKKSKVVEPETKVVEVVEEVKVETPVEEVKTEVVEETPVKDITILTREEVKLLYNTLDDKALKANMIQGLACFGIFIILDSEGNAINVNKKSNIIDMLKKLNPTIGEDIDQ